MTRPHALLLCSAGWASGCVSVAVVLAAVVLLAGCRVTPEPALVAVSGLLAWGALACARPRLLVILAAVALGCPHPSPPSLLPLPPLASEPAPPDVSPAPDDVPAPVSLLAGEAAPGDGVLYPAVDVARSRWDAEVLVPWLRRQLEIERRAREDDLRLGERTIADLDEDVRVLRRENTVLRVGVVGAALGGVLVGAALTYGMARAVVGLEP